MVHSEGFRNFPFTAGDPTGPVELADEELKEMCRTSASEVEWETRVWNVRLARSSEDKVAPYLSDVWPLNRPETYFKIRPIGLLVNVLVFMGVLLFARYFLEGKIRSSGSLFQFRILSMLITIAVAALIAGWVSHSFRLEEKRYECASELEFFEEAQVEAWIEFEKGTTYPLIVSQFLNHGDLFAFQFPGFRRIDTGFTNFDLIQNDSRLEDSQWHDLLANIETVALPVRLGVKCDASILEEAYPWVQRLRVEAVEIEFETLFDDQTPDDAENAVARFFGFPKLKTAELLLDSDFDQTVQLKPFLFERRLDEFFANGINLQGARFLLKHKSKLPSNSRLYFEKDVPQSLMDEIRKGLKPVPPYNGLRSVVPVVG